MNNEQLGRKISTKNTETVKGLLQEEKSDEILLVEELSHFTMYGVEVKTYEVLSNHAHTITYARNGVNGEFDMIIEAKNNQGEIVFKQEDCFTIIIHGMKKDELKPYQYLSNIKDCTSVKHSLVNHVNKSLKYAQTIFKGVTNDEDLKTLLG